jgi:nitrile hydratase
MTDSSQQVRGDNQPWIISWWILRAEVRRKPPFHADWEARVYGLVLALLARDLFTANEHRDAVERLPPTRYLGSSYYERWLAGVETLLVERGVLDAGAIEEAVNA